METSAKNSKRALDPGEKEPKKAVRLGLKHLVQCHCILPQYKSSREPVYHQFVVFSVIDESDSVITKIVQCNNCNVLHRVFEIGKSEIIIGKDEIRTLQSIDDIKLSIPRELSQLLESYDAQQPIWDECKFVLEEKNYPAKIVIDRESIDGSSIAKVLTIASRRRYSIDTVTYSQET